MSIFFRAAHRNGLVRLGAVSAATMGLAFGSAVVAVPASAQGPTLTLTPSELYYPCDGSQPVTASVTGFGAEATVILHEGSTAGREIGSLQTNAQGMGMYERLVNTATLRPGEYPIYAVQSGGPTAMATFTESTCP